MSTKKIKKIRKRRSRHNVPANNPPNQQKLAHLKPSRATKSILR